MKNKLLNAILLFQFLLLISCDALYLNPIDSYAHGNYWKSKEQCDRFIIGLHTRMRSKAPTFFTMGEYRSGLFEQETYTKTGALSSNMPIIRNNLSISRPGLTGWGGLYSDIMQINHAIEQISKGLDFLSESETNAYLGQLYGMRAYYYFQLHRTWGGVPIVSEPEVLSANTVDELNKARSTELETLNFIKEDIKRSVAAYTETNFTNTEGPKYWSKAATYSLGAEVYLWSAKTGPAGNTTVFSENVVEDLTIAKNYLLALEGKFTLIKEFANVFKLKDNSEVIFSIRYRFGEATNWFSDFMYNATTFTSYYGEDGVKLSDPFKSKNSGALWNDYDPKIYLNTPDVDQRKRATFFYYTDANKSFNAVLMIKFLGNIYNNVRAWDDDYLIYRYADVILMLAEVYNELNEPMLVEKYMNDIRERATNSRSFVFTTKMEAEQAILDERKIEFIGEGKYWYDVRRMKNGSDGLILVNNNPQKLLWPVDLSTLSKDPLLTQTPGYENEE